MIDPVVSLSWWQQHRDDVVLADVRWYLDGRSGPDAYEAGHLPGAVFVDLDQWLAGQPSAEDGRHPLPSPALFAGGMARLGISDADTVVAYDDAGGTTAARLVWMLRATGRSATLLDGGLQAYSGPLETGTPVREPAPFTPRPWPEDYLATIDEATDAGNVVVDARDRARYRGDTEPVDPSPRPHSRRPQPALPREPGSRRPVPSGPATPPEADRRRRRRRRHAHLLLRLRRHRLPQPADDRARRPRPRPPVPGLLVPVQPHLPPRRHRRHPLTHCRRATVAARQNKTRNYAYEA